MWHRWSKYCLSSWVSSWLDDFVVSSWECLDNDDDFSFSFWSKACNLLLDDMVCSNSTRAWLNTLVIRVSTVCGE